VERIGVRELRQHASRYLDRVKSGETVEVTERGHLIALLVPPGPAGDAREKLIGAGHLIPGSGPMRLPARRRVTKPSGAVLDELRSER
jgi:prevent-host-death family protein